MKDARMTTAKVLYEQLFTQFASYFMINMFDSKARSQNYILRLKEADFA